MARWIIAFVVAAMIGYFGVPWGRARAFQRGWFERSTQTRRRRSQRRPTHGGLVLAVAIAVGSALAGPSQPVARAVVLACVLAIVSGARAEQGKGQPWVVHAGRVAAAVAVPAMGIRAGLTANEAIDAVCTALIALGLMAGIRSIERTDATAPFVAAISATGLLVVGVRVDDPVLPAAAAIVGACGALVANTWPPSLVRLGTIGPTALGAALTAVAIELNPDVEAPRSALVPIFCLAVIAAGLVVPRWDRRLARRHLPPRLVLPLAAAAGSVAAYGIDRGSMDLPLAAALALGPVVFLAVVALTKPNPAAPEPRQFRLAFAVAGIVVLGALAAVAGLMAFGARRDMERGRQFATAGLDAARDGDLETAQQHFASADTAFAAARSTLGNPLVRAGELVPGIAPNVRNARTLAEVGGDLSSTAVAVAERAGADDLLVVDGRFPVEASEAVSAELAVALDTLRSSSERLADAASPFLLPEVRRGSEEVGERIADATNSLEVAAEATRLAPALLGADGERRWMAAILTPSEQRGAGGLAGDFAELRTLDGDIELIRTIPASDMNAATDPAVQRQALPEIYRSNYEGFRPARFWQNLSATPDVPTFGEAIASGFPLTNGGGPVDGVVILDPYGIAALLELSGPVTVPSWPVPITSDNAASILLFEHYDQLSQDQIDDFQGDVVEAVVDALTNGTLPAPSTLAATLGPAVTDGHLRLWAPDADAEALFERIGADGRLGDQPVGEDYVQLVTQSASESKIDWFLRRQMTYEAVLDPTTGHLDATATVTLTNTAPTTGASSYVIGEEGGASEVGENELALTVLSPHRPVSARGPDGQVLPINLGREQGLNALTVGLELPSGASTTIVFTFEGFVAPSPDYHLVVGRQPAVVPDDIDVRLLGPPGWRGPAEPSVLPPSARTSLAFRLDER